MIGLYNRLYRLTCRGRAGTDNCRYFFIENQLARFIGCTRGVRSIVSKHSLNFPAMDAAVLIDFINGKLCPVIKLFFADRRNTA